MSEYLHVEKPFLDQLVALGWKVTDQSQGFIPSDPSKSLRTSFREWFLPEVFRDAVRAINPTAAGKPWLTDRQLGDLRDQILRQHLMGGRDPLGREGQRALALRVAADLCVLMQQGDERQRCDATRADRHHGVALNIGESHMARPWLNCGNATPG